MTALTRPEEQMDDINDLADQGTGPDQDAGISPPRAIGMIKAMPQAGGDNYIQAALDADKRMGSDSGQLKATVSYLVGVQAAEDQKKSFRYYTFSV